MTTKKTFTQETFEKIKAGEVNPQSQKKRRLSRYILIADAVLVVFLFFFFNSRKNSHDYISSTVEFGSVESRISIIKEKGLERYHCSVSLKSLSSKNQELYFNNGVALMTVKVDGRPVIQKIIGQGIKKVELKGDDIRTFIVTIPRREFMKLAVRYPSKIVSARKTLIRFSKDYLPLAVTVTLLTGQEVGTTLNLHYEVDEQ